MQRLLLTGQVLPAGARLVVQHVFRAEATESERGKPLEVIYSFPLPRDAAMRRFRITGAGFEVESELQETGAAVTAYEEGIARGSLATLARQYGDGLVNLTVGNILPGETVTVWLEILAGVELRDDGFRFRFPFTLAPTYHEGARATLVSRGEGEMELPAAEFGDVILPRIREDAAGLHEIGFELALATELEMDEIASPSHPVRLKNESTRAARIALATGQDVPNRDLVLDGRYRTTEPHVLGGRDKEGVARFAAIVPSTSFGGRLESARRVVILLDRSGSMDGEPLSQARKAIEACLGVLEEEDSFGLVAFDDQAEVFGNGLVPATREARDQAREFLKQVQARGGTRLADGFMAAAKLLDSRGGDVLILTDGQVSGSEQILSQARTAGVRLHCLGIGAASQDRFLTLLARETGGVSRFVTPRERVDLSAVDLFASIGRPIASGVKAGPDVQPQPAEFVFAGTPVLVFGEGEAPIEIAWNGGQLHLPVRLSDGQMGETIRLLQGSRLITDWESRYSGVDAQAPLEKRQQNRVANRLMELSRKYGLASREMSLVAVVKRTGDRAGELPETQVVPVGMAQDVRFRRYFGRAAILLDAALPMTAPTMARLSTESAPPPPPGLMGRIGAKFRPQRSMADIMASQPEEFMLSAPPPSGRVEDSDEDRLLALASRMESDGGMPGGDAEARAGASLISLLAFVAAGHTATTGAFRSHVARLVRYLKAAQGVSEAHRKVIAKLLEGVERGIAPEGDWLKGPREPWAALEAVRSGAV